MFNLIVGFDRGVVAVKLEGNRAEMYFAGQKITVVRYFIQNRFCLPISRFPEYAIPRTSAER